ncbi:hypothetical protein LF1_33600 [Rubripirellula obstinata]|uniref:Uncharacterized protein n=1 Tax=Rubripirellula obstinata TaxID=406547 RepID=A0A5B1CI46_9BACT|nr:hypothetical protein [Rubripirellula obstinata]KAA1260818.1 hypothetical protein LF1_33600 [Rubripirellula obstinata]
MALLKLWNSLLGRSSTESPQADQSPQSAQDAGPAKASSPKPATNSAAKNSAAKKPTAKKSAQRLSLFGNASPHAALMKQLRGFTAESVLEISVGDGSRAVEVISLLNQNQAKKSGEEAEATKIRYAVIDQFEMGGGEHTLMQFHQTLRGAGIRPQVFPEVIDRGLTRVAHTIGSIDLILFSADAGSGSPGDSWATPEIKTLLSRVTHDHSLILFQKDDVWEKLALSELGSEPVYRRAA